MTSRQTPLTRWLWHTAALALLAAAEPSCIAIPQPDIPQDAVVTYETVRIEFPDEDPDTELDIAGSGGGDFATLELPAVGDPSNLRAFTLDTLRKTNAALFGSLDTLRSVSRCRAANRCEAAGDNLWTAFGERPALDVRFTLSREPQLGRFSYNLEASPKADPSLGFRSIFDGYFIPAPNNSDNTRIRLGEGVIRYHFDVLSFLAPNNPTGNLALAFRSEPNGTRKVRAFLRDLRGTRAPRPVTAIYEFTQNPDGSGTFHFQAANDFLGDGAPLEELALYAVWNTSGAARLTGRVTGGSIIVPEITVGHCWDDAGRTVWSEANPDPGGKTEGNFTDCADDLEALDFSTITFDAPPTDPIIDPDIPD